MLDVRWIAQNRELVKEGARRKGFEVDIDQLVDRYDRWRALQQEIQAIAAEKNQGNRELRTLAAAERQALIERMREMTAREKELRSENEVVEAEWRELLLLVPSPPAPGVPMGKDDTENVEIRRWGEVRRFDFEPRSHQELGELLDIIDKERAAKIAGSRTYFLKGDGALLEQAVLRLALDLLVYERGFTAMAPPVLVRDEAMVGTGYFPGGEDQAYRIPFDGLNLIGTSEVSLSSYYVDEILSDEDLPVRFAGISTCFRREAGAAGKDTAGLYRVHQFQKVEQVVVCRASEEESLRHHEEILANAEALMQALRLPYRVVNVCTGDLGRGQVQKFDIEAWMPSRGAYSETHSASRFHDFQARRLGLRYRDEDGKVRYCHTLNNTAIASPRILIPILELYQNEDGSITIPEVLRPYMRGRERIVPPAGRGAG
ncbi:MAG TPA: serine--tRNA ligase [Longimicrobiaceae bacterium]|nr:serine--tRNA ligase [Longimicrobiaceae bacterium]